jgi:hypothetical protein
MSSSATGADFALAMHMDQRTRNEEGLTMTHALNLTLPIKQDAETQAKLKGFADIFDSQVQPKIADAMMQSHILHFARIVVIDNKYIQVLTEYEGLHQEYTEFFRRALKPVFTAIFGLAEGAPDVNDPSAFFEYTKNHNIQPLGKSTSGSTDFEGNPAGWLFSAYDGKTVKEIQAALAQSTSKAA